MEVKELAWKDVKMWDIIKKYVDSSHSSRNWNTYFSVWLGFNGVKSSRDLLKLKMDLCD